jgi:Zn finger protein HypA/HybF involved in hydrogenase expression
MKKNKIHIRKENEIAFCGITSKVFARSMEEVTCKNCLKTFAKQDLEIYKCRNCGAVSNTRKTSILKRCPKCRLGAIV